MKTDSDFLRLARRVKDAEDAAGGYLNISDAQSTYLKASDAQSAYLGLGGGEITGPLRLTAPEDVSLTSTAHPLQIGDITGNNIAMDSNEIQARRNGAASTLYLNQSGGDVAINSDASGGVVWHAGNLPVEYGSWTPTFCGDSTNGSFTYSTRSGSYQRIGSTTYIYFKIVITSVSALPSGNYSITDLPFALSWWQCVIPLLRVSGTNSNYGAVLGAVSNATLNMLQLKYFNGSAVSNLSSSNTTMSTGSYSIYIEGGGSYRISG